MAIDPTQLQQLAAAGLGDYIGQGPQSMEDALYARMAGDIERQSGTNTQAALENTFGRGVGMGTPSADAVTPIARARNEALLKARAQAATDARNAQLAGLSTAAGVAQNAINSGQAGGLQQQQLNLAKRGQNMQRDAATTGAVGAGIGGLGASALNVAGMAYAPQIRKGLGLLAGGGDTGEKMPGMLAGAGGPSGIQAAPDLSTFAAPQTTPASYDFSGPAVSGLQSLSGADLPAFDLSSFDLPNWLSQNTFSNFGADIGY